MAKAYTILVIIFVLVVFMLIAWFSAFWWYPIKKTKINLFTRELLVWVDDGKQSRTRGLQWIIWLPGNCGAFFKFDRPAKYCFWNKNTFLPLKLIFMDKNRVVEQHYLPPFWKGKKTICASGAIDSAVEIPYK
jgi:uncharacterized membrane protein (UPF0127 family)